MGWQLVGFFCDNKERLACMVNDIIEELLDLEKEPKPQSPWWTSTYKDDVKATLKVGKQTEHLGPPFS